MSLTRPTANDLKEPELKRPSHSDLSSIGEESLVRGAKSFVKTRPATLFERFQDTVKSEIAKPPMEKLKDVAGGGLRALEGLADVISLGQMDRPRYDISFESSTPAITQRKPEPRPSENFPETPSSKVVENLAYFFLPGGRGKSIGSEVAKAAEGVSPRLIKAVAELEVAEMFPKTFKMIAEKQPFKVADIEPGLKRLYGGAQELFTKLEGRPSETIAGKLPESRVVWERRRLKQIELEKSRFLLNKEMDDVFKGTTAEQKKKAFQLAEANLGRGARERRVDPNELKSIAKKAINKHLKINAVETKTLEPGPNRWPWNVHSDFNKWFKDKKNKTPEAVVDWFSEKGIDISPKLSEYVSGSAKETGHGWRYTPEQGAQIRAGADPKVLEMAQWYRQRDAQVKMAFNIDTDIEAHVARYFNNSLANRALQVLKRPILGKKPVAGWEMKRAGAPGYIENLETAARRYFNDAAILQTQRELGADIERAVMKYKIGTPRAGYASYTGQYAPELTGKTFYVPEATVKYLQRNASEPFFYDQTARELYDSGKNLLHFTGRYWKANALAASMSTLVTNIGGAATHVLIKDVKDAAKLVTDLAIYREGIPADLKHILYDLWGIPAGLFDSLKFSPKVKSWHFGGAPARATTEMFAQSGAGFTEKALGTLLKPMAWGDDLLKRIVLFSEVGPEVRNIAVRIEDGTASLTEKKMWTEALRVVDTYGMNYENAPQWVKSARTHAIPFVNYLYNASKMMSSHSPFGTKSASEALDMVKHPVTGNPMTSGEALLYYHRILKSRAATGRMTDAQTAWAKEFMLRDKTERIARTLGLFATVTGLAMFDEWQRKRHPYIEALEAPGTPPELSMHGRFVIPHKGKVYGVRIAKYNPLLWGMVKLEEAAYHGIMGDWDKAGARLESAAKIAQDDLISIGPVGQLFNAALGFSKQYTSGMTFGENLGNIASSYLFLQRAMGPAAQEVERRLEPGKIGYTYKRPGFIGQATRNVPGLSFKYRGHPIQDITGKYKTYEPWAKSLSFWTGVNLKETDIEAAEQWNETYGKTPLIKEYRDNVIKKLYQPVDKTIKAIDAEIRNLESNNRPDEIKYQLIGELYEQRAKVEQNIEKIKEARGK